MPYKDPAKARENARKNQQRHRAKKTAERVAELEQRIASRPVWPPLDRAWAAGMFEGEGTVTITKSGRWSRSVVCLTSTDRQIVDFFQERWPGLISEKQRMPHHKVAWTWRLQGNFVLGFLEDVRPYLRTDAEQEKFDIVIESQRARWAGYRLEGHNDRMEEYRQRVSHLNRRGAPT